MRVKTDFVQRMVECISALAVIAMMVLAIFLMVGCSWDHDKFRTKADCEMRSPEGWVLICGEDGKATNEDGEILRKMP